MVRLPVPLPLMLCLATWLPACANTPTGTEVADVGGQADSAADALEPTDSSQPTGLPAATKLFDPQGVHTIAIEAPAPDWSALLADAADPKRKRDWHAATVTMDGQVYDQVGLRNFGEGSQQGNPKKPNMRLKFDQFTPTAQGPEGQVNLRLKAGGTEATFLREPLFFELLRSVGAPAPRWSFARVTVNGQAYGLYQAFEHPGERMFAHFLGQPLPVTAKDHDYTPAISCVGLQCPAQGCAALTQTYALQAGQGADLTQLIQAIEQAPDDQLQAQVGTIAAWDELVAVHAVEALASEVDGIMASGANFELFADGPGLLHTVRYGADETFYEHYALEHPWGPPNQLCPKRTERFFSRVLAIPPLRAQVLATWKALRCGRFEHKSVKAWIEALRPGLLAELARDPVTASGPDQAGEAMDDLEAWVADRNVQLTQLVGACPQ